MFAGGFIWVFSDEAPKRTDKGGILDSDGSNAPDGIVGPRREKEGSFYAIRAQWSPIQLKPLMITPHFDGSFFLTNEYTYTNLKECRMTYSVLACPTPLQGGGASVCWQVVMYSFLHSIPAKQVRHALRFPDAFREGDVLKLEAFDKDGHSMCTWTYPIHFAKPYFERHLASTPMTLQAVRL